MQNEYDHSFFRAVQEEDLVLVRRTIQMGADVSTTNNHHRNALMQYLSRSSVQMSIIKVLVKECKMDLDQRDKNLCNVVHYAAKHNHLDAVKFLLQWGADGDALSIHHQSPLIMAVQTNNVRLIHELLDWGAFPNTIDVYRYSPLLYAVTQSYQMVKLLVEAGAQVNYFSSNGLSPLKLAMKHKKHLICTYLQLKGAKSILPRPSVLSRPSVRASTIR